MREGKEQRAKGKEQRAKGKEQRAKSKEPRAKGEWLLPSLLALGPLPSQSALLIQLPLDFFRELNLARIDRCWLC